MVPMNSALLNPNRQTGEFCRQESVPVTGCNSWAPPHWASMLRSIKYHDCSATVFVLGQRLASRELLLYPAGLGRPFMFWLPVLESADPRVPTIPPEVRSLVFSERPQAARISFKIVS